MSQDNPLVEIEHLTYGYRPGESILEDVSVTVESGDYVGIIGPNGSGKTTFVKLALGLLPSATGSVKLFGVPIEKFREWHKIGYVPQAEFQGEANFPATVRDVIASGHLLGTFLRRAEAKRELRGAVNEAAEMAGVSHLLERRIGELSGGEQQRVFIAQALISDPSLLILDEPTAGIDLAAEETFYALLETLNRERGKTILLVSHDLEALAHHAKTALCLNRTVVYFGPAQGLHEQAIVESVFGRHAWHSHDHHTV